MHAIGASLIFGLLSWIYPSRFGYTTPLQTATVFTAVVVAMGFFVVALLIERSFAMFGSVLGAWLPWTLIFAATSFIRTYVSCRTTLGPT